jgi:drug/metabolite transporter superfamily protein YnfA
VKLLHQLKNRFSIMGELLAFLWLRRLWWMIPMVVVLLAFGLLIIFTHSSALAPFLYPLF